MRGLSWMYEFSTLMLHPTTTPTSAIAIGSMKKKKRGLTNNASGTLSMHPSLHLSSLQQEEWPSNLLYTFYKRLASLLADKWDHTYSKTLYWLCCRLSFSLLRSAIQYIRGARSSCGHAIHSSSPIDLVSTEAHFSQQ